MTLPKQMTRIMRIIFLVVFISFSLSLLSYLRRFIDDTIDERNTAFSLSDKTKSIPDGSKTNLFWFVQVSDIHVSRYHDMDRAPNLLRLCEDQLSIINPDFVIASGDLTDAKTRAGRGSKQYNDEWYTYHQVMNRCRQVVGTWLDIRGNHDTFNTPDFDDKHNMFKHYSSQGQVYPSSYVYHHKKDFGRYSFVGLDATLNPGPRRPFNFFGYLKKDREKHLQRLLNESRGSNMTVAFGHYPSSLIATQSGNSVREILRNVSAYLCGHLHTLGNYVPKMYAKHKTGMIELELGDWKDARLYRILAIDHDMLSITDVRFNQWPVVMVTNPKEASLIASYHEPLDKMRNSTHIRILIFSNGYINNVEVHIDDIHMGKAVSSEGPLYVLPWKPSTFESGLHTIRVTVEDSLHGRRIHQQTFSLDGSSPLLPMRSRIILKMDVAALAHFMFYATVFLYIFGLLLLRNCDNIKPHFLRNQKPYLQTFENYFNKWLLSLWMLTKVTKIYYTLQISMLYIAFGPWFVGELVEDNLGLVFVWGIFVKGHFLPVMLTYMYGLFQIIVFNIPLTLFLAYRLQYSTLAPSRRSAWHAARHIHFPFIFLLTLMTYIAIREFPSAYGTTALVVGPVRTGSVIISLILLYIAQRTDTSTLVVVNHSN